MDIVTTDPTSTMTFATLKNAITDLPPSDTRTSLLAALRSTTATVQDAQRAIEQWYEDAMDRANGWYKRRIQLVTVGIALILSVSTNADTFRIMNHLSKDSALRATAVRLATERVNTTPGTSPAAAPSSSPPATGAAAEEQRADNPSAGPPMTPPSSGITNSEGDFLKQLMNWDEELARKAQLSLREWLLWLLQTHALGWLFTTIAVSLGAPFWFDILKKIMDLRTAGKHPDERPKPPAKPDAQQTRAGVNENPAVTGEHQ
jgi:hypothetical protein